MVFSKLYKKMPVIFWVFFFVFSVISCGEDETSGSKKTISSDSCKDDEESIKGECKKKCKADETRDSSTKECKAKPKCDDTGDWDETKKACVCKQGFVSHEGKCLKECPKDLVLIAGKCEKKGQSCGSNEILKDQKCQCATGFVRQNPEGKTTAEKGKCVTKSGVTVPTITLVAQKPHSGDIKLSVTLKDDDKAADLRFSYILKGEKTETALKLKKPQDAIGVQASKAGNTTDFIWSSNLQIKGKKDLSIKVEGALSADGTQPLGEKKIDITVDNTVTTPPEVKVDSPGKVVKGDVKFNYEIKDAEKDDASLKLEFSLDNKAFTEFQAIQKTSAIKTDTVFIKKSFSWDSKKSLGATFEPTVYVRVTPSDSKSTGKPVTVGPFVVDNKPTGGGGGTTNEKPTVLIMKPQSGDVAGYVKFELKVQDKEADPVKITLLFSPSRSGNFKKANLIRLIQAQLQV